MLVCYCSSLKLELIDKPLYINIGFTTAILYITIYSELGSNLLLCYCLALKVKLIDKPLYINIGFTTEILPLNTCYKKRSNMLVYYCSTLKVELIDNLRLLILNLLWLFYPLLPDLN